VQWLIVGHHQAVSGRLNRLQPPQVPDSAGITKPFHYPELLARIGAVLGRVPRGLDGPVIRLGELAVKPGLAHAPRQIASSGMSGSSHVYA
jgi:hypothetical protein